MVVVGSGRYLGPDQFLDHLTVIINDGTYTTQDSCLAGLTHLGAAFLVLLGFALVLLAYKVVSTHM